MPNHPIIAAYNDMKNLFAHSALSCEVTEKLVQIFGLCLDYLQDIPKVELSCNTSITGKRYFAYEYNQKYSRPVNADLFEEGFRIDEQGTRKVDQFWENVRNSSIPDQNSSDITASIYVIAISFCCAVELLGIGGPKVPGTFFEKLVGHLYAKHLNIEPSNQMVACELDDNSISIPTDFIFNLGPNRPKFHIPAKTSTRDRVVQVWAQQRVLDGAYGVGRFLCLLTCISETELNRKKMEVNDICVPGQWINYQLFIAQIKRAYYLDTPQKYDELNRSFPRIHVKPFGDFFHENDDLID